MFVPYPSVFSFFFFNDTATTEIYTLSLHDALPISATAHRKGVGRRAVANVVPVIGLHVAVGLNLKLAVVGLDEEMFPVPSRIHGRPPVFLLGGFLVNHHGFRWARGFGGGCRGRSGQRIAGVNQAGGAIV